MKQKAAIWALFVALVLQGCATMKRAEVPAVKDVVSDGVPAAEREFRAAWVATVANIDWPSRPGLSTEVQQREVIAILDTLAELNMNAAVLQIRTECDAFYPSDLEPWSRYLTGRPGVAPEPYYDPLQFWIDESHARGIELHVWFNPYRAHAGNDRGDAVRAANHVVAARPHMARKLADGKWWLDPAMPEVIDHSFDVVMDVVRRYDIDGVHMDDYFYPYPSYNNNADFPDDDTWKAYQAAGGTMSRGDWRRDAVNRFMERLYEGIKAEKPHVKFGLSPFGIYRPGFPASIQGFDQYDQLYADALLWLREGWVDYWTPQLYWPISQVPQSYATLLAWWAQENVHGRNLWPGLGTYRVNNDMTSANFKPTREVANEIMVTRALVPNGPGHVHFSMKHLQRNYEGIAESLRKGVYAKPALVPPSPWLDAIPPTPPTAKANQDGNNLVIQWQATGTEPVRWWVVYVRQGGAWRYEIVPGHKTSLSVQTRGTITRTETANQGIEVREVTENARPVDRVAVSAVDRLGNESLRTILDVR
ncbi:MAG: family 10 glycosylhydrolase [Candidatus Sumerlaeia bacterium]|nr:family 10 glycosylhydrolase [Candidatus Sumerlaeia bacterium]